MSRRRQYSYYQILSAPRAAFRDQPAPFVYGLCGCCAKMHDFEMDGIGKPAQPSRSRTGEEEAFKSELLMKSVKLLGR